MLVSLGDSRKAFLLLRTKPKQEYSVIRVLNHRVLDVYCPHLLEPHGHARAPVGRAPLFPSYVFARCDVSSQYNAASYCPGVFGFVRFGECVAAVEDEFVELLRSREGERGYLAVREVCRPPVPGQRARVPTGRFAGYEGLVERYIPAGDRVRLLLKLVGGGRRVEVDARRIRCA